MSVNITKMHIICTCTCICIDIRMHVYVAQVHGYMDMYMLEVAKQHVYMSVSCLLPKYRDHYTSNIIVAASMQHCNYYVYMHMCMYIHVHCTCMCSGT